MTEHRGETFVMEDGDQLSFSTFVLGLASSALIHLGEAPNPDTGGETVNLVLARQSLDLLDLLRHKTRGNLTAEEEQLFVSLLTDLRLRFVQKQHQGK
ncbi:MAG: DUF1844 domain-containing protein [Myxococcales bacterium]|nr:DUF1844 domain-containing protein [Myxococcales bacterium]MDP3502059.1 DUF1844 domain-containing protein [Myxococcales bacterium]